MHFYCYYRAHRDNHGVDGSNGGFENIPKALVIIFIMCLVPQLLMAALISAKNSKEQIA